MWNWLLINQYNFFTAGVLTALISLFYIDRLFQYLIKNKPKRWKEILQEGRYVYIGVYYPTLMGLIRFYVRWNRYVFNDLDIKDKTIKNCKKRLRILLTFLYIFTLLSVIADGLIGIVYILIMFTVIGHIFLFPKKVKKPRTKRRKK